MTPDAGASMAITDHWLEGARVVKTKHIGDWIKPTLGIIHESGTRIIKGACVRYCQNNKRKVAYHIVIERDGEVVQMAPFNRRVNHAGRSKWKGRSWCNNFSIGIALVGPTELTSIGKAFFSRVFKGAVKAGSPYHGNNHYWLPYTDEQKASLMHVMRELHAHYELDTAGHYQAAPGRKIDPSPLIDLSKYGAAAIQDLPPVAKAETTDKTLSRESREYKTANWVKRGVASLGVAEGASHLAKAFEVDKINQLKSYLDTFYGFREQYGIFILIGGCLAIWASVEAIQYWKRESYDDGRYETSGAEDEPDQNPAGGDWA